MGFVWWWHGGLSLLQCAGDRPACWFAAFSHLPQLPHPPPTPSSPSSVPCQVWRPPCLSFWQDRVRQNLLYFLFLGSCLHGMWWLGLSAFERRKGDRVPVVVLGPSPPWHVKLSAPPFFHPTTFATKAQAPFLRSPPPPCCFSRALCFYTAPNIFS